MVKITIIWAPGILGTTIHKHKQYAKIIDIGVSNSTEGLGVLEDHSFSHSVKGEALVEVQGITA